jgi:dynein light intermediate chain
MTIQAYQTLYESSIAYGMRKALMAEQSKNDMNSSIKTLEETNEEQTKEIKKLEQEIADKIRSDEEDHQRLQKAHDDQVKYLQDLINDYKKELETLLSTPAK